MEFSSFSSNSFGTFAGKSLEQGPIELFSGRLSSSRFSLYRNSGIITFDNCSGGTRAELEQSIDQIIVSEWRIFVGLSDSSFLSLEDVNCLCPVTSLL